MLAIKPNKDEAFLREVDEELRKERMNAMFARYGWLVIAGVVLLLAAIGGWIWYQEHRKAVAGEQGEALISALQAAESGNTAGAQATFDELAESNIEGYRAAGLFSRAGLQLEAGDEAAAIATLKAIAEDSRLAEPYRHAALIRQTALEFDSIPPAEVIRRLGPLALEGNPWFGSAGEMVAIAHLKENRPERAAPIFAAIARDERLPDSIRTRAVQMAGSLGVDAVADIAAAPANGAVSAPEAGQAREEAE
jgi:hypothetical protein